LEDLNVDVKILQWILGKQGGKCGFAQDRDQ
jgi:hypothetical protein